MNTKNIMLAIWNQLTRKVAWRNIFVTHNAFGIFSQYSHYLIPPKGGLPKHKNQKSRKSLDLQDFAEREGFEPPVPLSTPVFKTGAFDHSAISP